MFPEPDRATAGRTRKHMTPAGDPHIIRGVIGQTGTDVITYRYNMYNVRMDPNLTSIELMIRQIDMTDEGATTLA